MTVARLAPYAGRIVVLVSCLAGTAVWSQVPGQVAPRQPIQRQPVPRQPTQRQPQQGPVGRPIGGGPANRVQRAPIRLTPQEHAQLLQLLSVWEQHTRMISNLRCEIEVWENNPVFAKKTHKLGELRYKSPDKGSYEVLYDVSDPKNPVRIQGTHWTCDGKSIFDLRHEEKKLVEYRLPDDAQGSALSNSPIPFLFGAKTEELLQRYFMKETTSAEEAKNHEHWLVAYPRHRRDAANFSKAEVILHYFNINNQQLLLPYGLRLTDPNGKTNTAHVFKNYVINQSEGWLKQKFGTNPFHLNAPAGYQYVLEQAGAQTPTPPPQAKPSFWNPLGLGTSRTQQR